MNFDVFKTNCPSSWKSEHSSVLVSANLTPESQKVLNIYSNFTFSCTTDFEGKVDQKVSSSVVKFVG